MKKFIKMLSIIGVTVIGALVSSCQVEDINTTFEPKNAVAEITVTTFDVTTGTYITGKTGLVLTASSTANNPISISGNLLKIEGGPSIQKQTVTINAEYNGQTGSTTVDINPLRAGGNASYGANIEVGSLVIDAVAVVQVSVWDNETEKDVTARSTFSHNYSGEYKIAEGATKGSYVITGKNGISAFEFEITAKYGDDSEKATVQIGNIGAGEVRNYLVPISVGEAVEPNPAVAKITVNVLDAFLEKDVTSESEISAELSPASSADIEVNDNVVTVSAGKSLEIVAQDITIKVKYGELSETAVVSLDKIPENVVVEKSIDVAFNKVSAYVLNKVESKSTVDVGTFFSTHNLHTYTHEYGHGYGHGHDSGEWLYNETEFILETTVKYTDAYGISDLTKVYLTEIANDINAVDIYAAGYEKNYVEEEAVLNIKVSAFARYSAYATRTTTVTKYDVVRYLNDTEEVVGKFTVTSVATQAEYCEAAMPGHEGHYVHGHGHADEHGYSSNAGGGIIWSE